ncbi:Abi family protein [Cohnella luojiensis]|uniref:Abi family protein n=1 Tax=Cohnella luojiensis TaxID=652876 RepID=A0A4Y8LT42_9BACL|nr:Abi family protein [Cohnella luojiensis]
MTEVYNKDNRSRPRLLTMRNWAGHFIFWGILGMDKSYESELKPPATYKEMIDILRSRGLKVGNENRATDILKRINYYRLTGYLLPYKINEEKYIDGTVFEHVVELYDFDMRLRSLLLDIFEYVEVSMRSQISYHLAHKYGSE